jgi:preprotein translocase subunit SecA
MQRGHAAAIVDEADSVFIDEATLPLVLATDPSTQHSRAELYRRAAAVAAGLRETNDFVLDQPNRRARLTQVGLSKVMDAPALPPPEWLDRSWPACMEQALVAEHLLCRDVDYVVDRGQLMLVDQFTGRIFADRTLRHGLHQAVQAKENLAVTAEPQAQARISRQRFLRLYKTLCGMTGTALGSEREFREVFRLPVTVVPPRVACRRAVLPARFFSDKHSKRLAIKDEVRRCHAAGQPVLIGTRTIVESRCLAELFREGSLPFALLDGTQDAAEASLVARAGQLGAITLATNVAGRGTDIRLGPGAAERGGLHVIVSEPHAARRIDWQLLGRAARQGDPGSTRMFASADDDLIRLHASQLARRMRAWADPSGEIHRDLSAAIERVQRGVESVHRQHRRRMLRFDAWLEEFMNTLHGGGPDA